MATTYTFHDSETTTNPERHDIEHTYARGALYVSGLSSETVTLQAREAGTSDSFVSVLSGKSNGWHQISELPEGELEVVKSAGTETATTKLQVF
jgi:hypothetical protein